MRCGKTAQCMACKTTARPSAEGTLEENELCPPWSDCRPAVLPSCVRLRLPCGAGWSLAAYRSAVSYPCLLTPSCHVSCTLASTAVCYSGALFILDISRQPCIRACCVTRFYNVHRNTPGNHSNTDGNIRTASSEAPLKGEYR